MVLNIVRQCITFLIILFLAPVMAKSTFTFNEHAPPSPADYMKMTPSKNPLDKGWLPMLIGMPSPDQVAQLTDEMLDVMNQDTDPTCTSVNLQLRKIIFQHFLIYQHLVNAQNIYLDEKIAHHWAHVLAMILKESSGDSTSVTAMSGKSISTYRAKTNIKQWEKEIYNLTGQSSIPLNTQTNFGLTQLSADRLFAAFKLAKNQRYNTAFLEGKEGADTPEKAKLNTAIAIRRMIWFYQDFAQGRTSQNEGRIHQNDITNPEYAQRYQEGLDLALLYCGTPFMFHGQYHGEIRTDIQKAAVASIAYCKLGNSQEGYGESEMDEKCFAEWVTLCPALNIDIATLTPLSYFETRDATPVCEQTFKRLIKTKPDNNSDEKSSIPSIPTLSAV